MPSARHFAILISFHSIRIYLLTCLYLLSASYHLESIEAVWLQSAEVEKML